LRRNFDKQNFQVAQSPLKQALLLFALFTLISLRGEGQRFVISDVLVSDPYAQISDTEFDQYKKRMCWQSPDNKLWVCNLDTVTWALTCPDGRETLIDTGLVSLEHTSNAGEWGFDQSGSYIVYNKLVHRWKYIAMATETGFNWSLVTFFDSPFRLNPHATRNPNDSVIGIHYFTGIWREGTKYKIMDNPCWEFCIHNFIDAHWANDEQLLTGILPNDQVALFNPADPANPMQITFQPGTVFSRPYLWRAPEYGNSHMMFAVANGTEIRVFRESRDLTDQYKPYLSFTSPSGNPLLNMIASPEPVVYNGQSYITFMASSSTFETSLKPAEIWIVKVDSINPVFRMISDSLVRIRTDPEPFITSDSLLTFYTEVVDSIAPFTVFRTRKCNTGFGSGVTAGTNPENYQPNHGILVWPNPFSDHINLKGPMVNENCSLVNSVGEVIWSGKDISQHDFSGLKPGNYFLHVTSGNSVFCAKLLKEK
jgi:hypothetical protein